MRVPIPPLSLACAMLGACSGTSGSGYVVGLDAESNADASADGLISSDGSPTDGADGPTDDTGETGRDGCSSAGEPITWEWARGAGSTKRDELTGIAYSDESVIVAGYFTGETIAFGPHILDNPAGESAIFVVKYDSGGDPVWAKTAVSDSARTGGLATGPSGSVYVTGTFRSSLQMDGTTLTSRGAGDAFLIVLDSAGNLSDAVAFGGAQHNEEGEAVAVDGAGNVSLAGTFWSDSLQMGATTLTNSGFGDLFVAVLDSNLGVTWAKSATGSESDGVSTIGHGAGGEVYVGGDFLGDTISFDGFELLNAGTYDMFWAAYDTQGNTTWARSTGGIDWEFLRDLVVDSQGALYLTGMYSSNEVAFGGTDLVLHAPGGFSNDMYVAKCDSLGNVVWAIDSWQTTSEAQGFALAIDQSDQVYAVGGTFDGATFGDHSLSTHGEYDFYLIKLDGDGNVLWATGGGGDQNDFAYDVALDGNNGIYVAGGFRSSQM